MKLIPTEVDGCRIVELEPIADERGFSARAWCSDGMAQAGVADHIAQINVSRSAQPGTNRGLHWRPDPDPEAKFVRCIGGRIGVCVDSRHASPTHPPGVGVEFTPENRRALAVPAGCAHAYQTLDPNSEVLYTASAPYVPVVEIGARWNDPAFGIEWPIIERGATSENDHSWPNSRPRGAGHP